MHRFAQSAKAGKCNFMQPVLCWHKCSGTQLGLSLSLEAAMESCRKVSWTSSPSDMLVLFLWRCSLLRSLPFSCWPVGLSRLWCSKLDSLPWELPETGANWVEPERCTSSVPLYWYARAGLDSDEDWLRKSVISPRTCFHTSFFVL